jgi:hypothetical protein
LTENNMETTKLKHIDKSTSFNLSMVEDPVDIEGDKNEKAYKDEAIQVNFASVMANMNKDGQGDQLPTGVQETALKKPSGSSTLNEEKEVSSVIVQTDETLETYKILASLIDSWVAEVGASKQRAEVAESRSNRVEDELQKLEKKFKNLQKAAYVLNKDYKRQQDEWKQKHSSLKSHHAYVLQKLHEQLGTVVVDTSE